MSKTLALIAIIILVLCVTLFGLARTIGGDAIFHDSRNFAGIQPLIDMATHKDWKWDGGDSLALESAAGASSAITRRPPGKTSPG